MLDNKSMKERLKETLGAQSFRKLKENGAEKMRSGIELSLKEDILINPEKYTFHPSTKQIPEGVQKLYRDVISYGIAIEREAGDLSVSSHLTTFLSRGRDS